LNIREAKGSYPVSYQSYTFHVCTQQKPKQVRINGKNVQKLKDGKSGGQSSATGWHYDADKKMIRISGGKDLEVPLKVRVEL
jgi:hypothetical protein